MLLDARWATAAAAGAGTTAAATTAAAVILGYTSCCQLQQQYTMWGSVLVPSACVEGQHRNTSKVTPGRCMSAAAAEGVLPAAGPVQAHGKGLVGVGGEVHRSKQASEVRMQELKRYQGAATLYACRSSPPSFPHTRQHYLQHHKQPHGKTLCLADAGCIYPAAAVLQQHVAQPAHDTSSLLDPSIAWHVPVMGHWHKPHTSCSCRVGRRTGSACM